MSQFSSSITLSDTEFRQIAAIAASEAGLAIPDAKKSLVQSRVARRMRSLGFGACSAYLTALEGDAEETRHLICALTTNVSHFFRERHHFDYLRETLLAAPVPERLRIWSAGCSNGQEPYSLAMQIIRTVPDASRRDVRILATDIDHNVLVRAKTAQYSESEIDGILPEDRDAFLENQRNGTYEIAEKVQQLVRFRHLNLNAPGWPMKGPFDAIFCRNVVIYFDEETQARLWPRFRAMLKPGGTLMLGHSERVHPIAGSGFEAVGVTTYRRL